MILAVLPFGTGALLYVINPDYMSVLFTDPTGNTILGAAIVSLGVGMVTIRALIRRALS
jgi:tight adherence protein B